MSTDNILANELGETNGTWKNGEYVILPRYGIYDYETRKTKWVSDDYTEVEVEVERLCAEGNAVCVSDGVPPVWYCRCGTRHFNGTSDYCNSCLRGD